MRTPLVMLSAAIATTLAVHAGSRVQADGKATGTLTVATSVIQLAHAYAFAEPAGDGKAGYRILVTDKPLTPAAMKHAAAAGSDEDARQALAVELADAEIRGLEAVVNAERAVQRLNVYSPDSAMGMMLLAKGNFEATAFDAQQLAGRLVTSTPVQTRIGKPVQYDATFAARVQGAAAK